MKFRDKEANKMKEVEVISKKTGAGEMKITINI
jgi:hypothetical protein